MTRKIDPKAPAMTIIIDGLKDAGYSDADAEQIVCMFLEQEARRYCDFIDANLGKLGDKKIS